jgi:hypothetical protein
MSRKPTTIALALILVATALNISILIFNLSLPSRAAVAGMDYHGLHGLEGECNHWFGLVF